MSELGSARFQGPQHTPLVVGHRGSRNGYPENTILAMRKGVEAGATVVETDIQLAKDHVVVHCHDVDTGRCYDRNFDVESTEYVGKLDQLRTKGFYKERMPTLKETAEMFVNDPAFANVRLMLDIKRSNRPHVVPHVVRTLTEVAPIEYWAKKLTFGVWKADVMAVVAEVAPQIPVTFIGIEHRNARLFMETWPHQVEAISIAYFSLGVHGGEELMAFASERNVKIYSWTCNDPEVYKWAVAARLEGVITDFPDVANGFFKHLTESELYSTYFTADLGKFYPLWFVLKMYSLYLTTTCYLFFADNFPMFFRRY